MITVADIQDKVYETPRTGPGLTDYSQIGYRLAHKRKLPHIEFPEQKIRDFLKGYDFEFAQHGHRRGVYGSCNNSILRVNGRLRPTLRLIVAIHEMGHALMHWRWTSREVPAWREEIEAEAVSYIVSNDLGLGMPDAFFLTYIKGQAETDDDVNKALNWGRYRISDASREILCSLR